MSFSSERHVVQKPSCPPHRRGGLDSPSAGTSTRGWLKAITELAKPSFLFATKELNALTCQIGFDSLDSQEGKWSVQNAPLMNR